MGVSLCGIMGLLWNIFEEIHTCDVEMEIEVVRKMSWWFILNELSYMNAGDYYVMKMEKKIVG